MAFQFASKSKQPAQHKSSPPLRKTARSLAPVHPVLQLQRTIGNQGVLRLLESQRIQPKCACGSSCPRCRRNLESVGDTRVSGPQSDRRATRTANLKVSEPGDKYEQEGDRVADQVMRMPDSQVQRQEEGGSGPTQRPTRDMPAASSSGGTGQPLPESVRSYFEPRFGHDFSKVRVHTDAEAADSAREIGARAYTVGPNVVLGEGQYAPKTGQGRRLLAHELAHVVQRGYAASRTGSELSSVYPSIGQRSDLMLSRQPPDAGVADLDAGSSSKARNDQIDCVKRLGGCAETRSAEIPTKEEIARYNGECRSETIYSGPAVTPTDAECTAGSTRRTLRVRFPVHPGWVPVRPTYWLIKSGEPFEFPHFLKVREESAAGSRTNVTALEGLYTGTDAFINTALLGSSGTPKAAAKTKFDRSKGEFWYGGVGPVTSKSDPKNPVPRGKHDLEIPDFHHKLGSGYGAYGTTWFRIGHSGDRYLHPGQQSLGCSTITDTSEWPKIWKYLITSRKDSKSVGEHVVV